MNARDELVEFLVGQIPARTLAGFQPSDSARHQVWDLIAKEKESRLVPKEKLELEDYLKLEHLLVLAKAKALMSSILTPPRAATRMRSSSPEQK